MRFDSWELAQSISRGASFNESERSACLTFRISSSGMQRPVSKYRIGHAPRPDRDRIEEEAHERTEERIYLDKENEQTDHGGASPAHPWGNSRMTTTIGKRVW